MVNITAGNQRSRSLSILLALWIYTYALFYFIPLIVSEKPILMYVWLTCIDVLVVLNCRKISVKVIKFSLVYVLVVLINIIFVSYKYYVAIDAFSGMAVFLPALLIIASSLFDLKDFLKVWHRFAIILTLLSPFVVFLMQKKLVNYGVFTYLNLPNSIIFSFAMMVYKEKHSFKKKINVIFAMLNFIVILVFGGRMAALAAAFSIFLGYIISPHIKNIKKLMLVLFVLILGLVVFKNMNLILKYIQMILNKYNFNSRSLSLIIEQLNANGTGIYLSRRDIIYERIINYIIDRRGLPGGFGVSLNITNGQFYNPHNLLLQLAVMFGVLGAVFVIILILYRLKKIKKYSYKFEYNFILLFLFEYLLISFTGGSILNNFVAIIGIGMTFFYRFDDRITCNKSLDELKCMEL